MVALTWAQVQAYQLPPQLGKASDPRAAAFAARHGLLVQVELDALPLTALRELYQEGIDRFWDMSEFREVLEQEEEDRDAL